jgi:hypothetical protein
MAGVQSTEFITEEEQMNVAELIKGEGDFRI